MDCQAQNTQVTKDLHKERETQMCTLNNNVKPTIMKYFEITFQPTNRRHKEWIHTENETKQGAIDEFAGGVLISCAEIDEEDYEIPEHLL